MADDLDIKETTETTEDKEKIVDSKEVEVKTEEDAVAEDKDVEKKDTEDAVAGEEIIKEIAPDLCDYGIKKIKEGGFSKKQVAYIADYLKENQEEVRKFEEEKIDSIAKEFKKEELISISNFFSQIKEEAGQKAFDNLKINKDFLTLMKNYIQTNKQPLVKSDDPASNTSTIEDVKKNIQKIRDNPVFLDHFNPAREGFQKELDGLYRKLIKLENNN